MYPSFSSVFSSRWIGWTKGQINVGGWIPGGGGGGGVNQFDIQNVRDI